MIPCLNHPGKAARYTARLRVLTPGPRGHQVYTGSTPVELCAECLRKASDSNLVVPSTVAEIAT
jgi:hypothetical protein